MSLVYIWPFRQTRGKIRADFLTDESKTCVDEPLRLCCSLQSPGSAEQGLKYPKFLTCYVVQLNYMKLYDKSIQRPSVCNYNNFYSYQFFFATSFQSGAIFIIFIFNAIYFVTHQAKTRLPKLIHFQCFTSALTPLELQQRIHKKDRELVLQESNSGRFGRWAAVLACSRPPQPLNLDIVRTI